MFPSAHFRNSGVSPIRNFDRDMAFVSQIRSLPLASNRRPRPMVSPQQGHSRHLPAKMSFADTQPDISENGEAERSATGDEIWNTGKIRASRQIRGGGRKFRGYLRSQGKRLQSQSLLPNPPGMRVSAGSARGRRLKSPNVYLRPMMAKVREALFTMLGTLGALRDDGVVLDLFAGSGSVGIEALSRGMHRAVFVDFAQECVDSIGGNLSRCLLEDRGQPIRAKVEDFIADGVKYNDGRHYDLITITPPYEEVDYAELITSVANSNCVGEGTFVVVEYPVELKTVPPAIGHRLVGIRNRRYGRTVIALYACQPALDIEPRPDEFIR